MNFVHVMQIDFLRICIIFSLCAAVLCVRKYSSARKEKLREEVRLMFQHAYDGYLNHASDFDELRPLTCDGINTWGSYSLTLIDALDTLAVMGNYTEFRRVANLIIDKVKFDKDINVSVFETNIRIVGGLLSAHLLARKAGMELEPGWPCNGPLLRLAEDVAKRLIPAFDSKTGMPYGTVNLMYGVPRGETSVTCTAGVGTFIVEFGTLSRLTGDPIFEEVALNAIYSLWKHRSPIGLLGNHIDVQTGQWTAQDAGIGAGIDSFFEYLVKGAILLNRPDLLEIFHEGRTKIDEYMKRDDWYLWVGMNKGQVTLPVFQSLEAYWPGVLSLIGDINSAMKIIHNYHTVWRQYGFLPEFYNIPGAEAASNRESYPLRPELVESAMYLYRATKDPYLLEIGEDMLRSIQHSARTSCGYATIKNVRDHRRDNRMESFFLSETTKYLYLLFDDDNFLHNNGRDGQIIETPNGICIIESGGYIFNTEAHPVDPSALNCCYGSTHDDIFDDFNLDDYSDEMFLIKESQQRENDTDKMDKYACPGSNIPEIEKINNLSVDIELTDATNTKTNLAKDLVDRFQAIKKEQQQTTQVKRFSTNDLIKIVNSANTVDDIPIVLSNFMKTQSVEPDVATKVFQVYSYTPFAVEYSSSVSIWNMFLQNHRIISNFEILERLSHDKYLNGTDMTVIINDILDILNSTSKESSKNTMNRTNHVHELMLTVQKEYYMRITNGTEMFIFSKSCALDSGKKLDDNVTLELFLLEEKLYNIPVPDPYVTNAIDANIFNKLHTLLHLRKRILDLVQRTENLSENVPTSNSARNDSPEAVTTTDDTYLFKAEKSSNSPEKPINKDPVEAVGNLAVSKTDETTNTSILTDIMHSIMDSAMPVKSKFNDQKLLQRIRAQGVYMNQIQKYELLACKAPTFIQRFAYRYDVV